MVIRVQETYQELPGVRQGRASNPMDGPTATSIVAKQAQQTGQAMQRAASGFAEIVQAEQEKANKVRLNDAYNQASAIAHELRYNKDSGYLRLKGGDAVKGVQGDDGAYRPITESYGEKLGKELARIRNGLGNSALAQQFDIAAGDLSTKFRNDAVTYEAEQSSVYATQVQDATVMTSANKLAADPFGGDSAFHVSRARDAAILKGRAAGLTGDALEQATQATLGKMHIAVVDSMLDAKNAAGAKQYFELHANDFGALDKANVKAKLDTAYAAAEAIGAVDEVIAAHPLTLNQPANKKDMDAALRARFADNPEGLKAARSELAQRISDHEFQESEANAGNVSAVWNQLLGGRSMASVEGTRAWLALPGDKRASLKSAWDNYQSGTISDDMLGGFLDKLLDENYLAGVTSAELQALIPYYGAQRVGQLGTAAKNVRANRAGEQYKATLDQPNIPPAMVNDLAQASGLNPFYAGADKNEDARQKAYVADLHTKMYTLAAQHQMATGKVIPPGEMEAFLKAALAREGIRRGLTTFGPQAPTPGTAQSTAVAQYLQQRGLPPTVENQRKAMLDMTVAGQLLVDE
jgi:hypothetical protein